MLKIPTNGFKRLVENNLDSRFTVPSISSNDIKEFKIGKSYFYTIINKTKFQIIYNQKNYSIYDILNAYFAKRIPLSNATTSFRNNFSYLNFFEPHRNNYHFIRLDIRSFFHSIDIEDIKKVFKPYFYNVYIDENKLQHIVDAFINLVTYEIPEDSLNVIKGKKEKRVLPMGFKTSPMISNVIFRQLDIQIQKLCSERNIIYSRYADDMLFSSVKNNNYIHSDDFVKEIRVIIGQMKFKLNKHKMLKAKHTLSLNGYTIDSSNKELRLSNKKTSIIKKLIYKINEEKKAPDEILKKLFQYKIEWKFKPDIYIYEKYNIEQLLNKVVGYRSYLLSIVKFNKKYQCTEIKTIDKYMVIINDLEEIIEQYRNEIVNLDKKIEKKKEDYNNGLLKSIDELSFTGWQKEILKNSGYLTLKSLKGVKEKHLYDTVKGIGKVKAKKIMATVKQELLKLRIGRIGV